MFPSGWCFSTLSPRAGFLTSAYVRIQSINQINQQTSGCMAGKFSVLYNQHECGESAGWRGIGLPNPSRETKFSGAYTDRDTFSFPVQLTTNRIGNLTLLIHTLLSVMTIHNRQLL